MRKSLLLCMLTSLVAGLLGGATGPFAQAAQTFCPDPGTVVTVKVLGVQDQSTTWQGSDPSDPLVCRGTDYLGVPFSLIVGIYPSHVRRGKEAVESAMKALLSNSTDVVDFDFTLARTFDPTLHDTWKRLGTGTLDICGKPLPVVRYLRTEEGINVVFAGQWDLLYDPSYHVFARSVFHVIRSKGAVAQSYEFVSIVPC